MKILAKSTILPCLSLFCLPGSGHAAEDSLFKNVAPDLGLAGVAAKDCIFVDLNGDGYHDIVLDCRRFFLSDGGARFLPQEDVGIEFPRVTVTPVKEDGSPDSDKAQERDYVPQYLSFADLDNDGDQDAAWGVLADWVRKEGERFVAVEECDPGVRSRIYLNDGHGRFAEAPSSEYSVPDSPGPAKCLALVDANADGLLDLFEGRDYRRYGELQDCGIDRLWIGDGKGRFKDGTEAAGLMTVPEPEKDDSSRPTYGVTHGDLNNDGLQDLLALTYGRQWNRQWQNQGGGRFADVGRTTGFAGDDITHGRYPGDQREAERPFRSNGNTFDCAIADYDNDGDLDCFLGEIAHAWAGEASDPPSLLVNLGEEGDWKFERHPVMEFLPERPFRDQRNYNYGDLHAGWLDYDNDQLQDLLIASGDYPDGQFLRLYRQEQDHTFSEVTEEAGFNWEGCGDLSLGDFDRDGDVDILIGRSFMRLNQEHRDRFMDGMKLNEVGLFRNEVGNRNHWLNVRLQGKGKGSANRSGIGARIFVTTGDVTQIREIRAGSGLTNHQDPPEACFGLGEAEKIDRLVVRWPDRTRKEQVFKDVPADRFVTVVQGSTRLLFEEK
ncbi:MAG: CRTAC1 family protein [Planctomycetota bacterium]